MRSRDGGSKRWAVWLHDLGTSVPLLACLLGVALPPPGLTETIFEIGGRVQRPQLTAGGRSPQLVRLLNSRRGPLPLFVFRVVIERDGRVGGLEIIRPKTVSPEAAAALRRDLDSWRFIPATLEGRPVAVHYTLTASFCPH